MEHRVLGRILTAQALSSLGTSVSTIALAFMVYELTGSVLHMGAIMAVSTFPLVVTSFVGGALLDRFSAKSIMVLADLGRAVFIFLLPVLAEQAVGLIYVVAALMGILSSLFNPGQIKLVGELARGDYLVRANSYLSVSRDGAELLGYLVGGVLVTYVGYSLTFTIDAGSYLLSALLLLGLPRALPRTGPVPKLAALLADTPWVVGHIWRRPLLRTNLLLAVLASGAIMMTVPNTYGLALEVFETGAPGLAALEVAMASGLILGGLAISRMRLRGDKNRYVAGAILAIGVCLVAVGLSPWFWVSAFLLGLAGMFNVGTFVPSMTMFQEIPDQARKGRLIAIRAGFGQIGATVGLLLGGVLGAQVGITRLFVLAGVGGIALTLLIYLPHRAAAARRASQAWTAATEGGARRVTARARAEEAALTGELALAGEFVVPESALLGDVAVAGDGLDLEGTGRTERGRRGIL